MTGKDVLLVVIGAGASYDCLSLDVGAGIVSAKNLPDVSCAEARPPLTQELLGQRTIVNRAIARYSACRPLVAELREVFAANPSAVTQSLEEALAEYEKRAESNPVIARHVTAFLFVLRDVLWACTEYMTSDSLGGGVTNYHWLVNDLYQRAATDGFHVCFVSFNYDMILERACRDVWGFDEFDVPSYITDETASVLKPHGSVNWYWLLLGAGAGPLSALDRQVIATAGESQRVDMTVIRTRRHVPDADGVAPGRPALALPVANKTEFVWPREQEKFFTDLQGSVRGVLTIGWRAADQHFVELLSPLVRERSPVFVVTGGPAASSDADRVQGALHRVLGERGLSYRKLLDGFSALQRVRALDALWSEFRR